MNYFSGSSLPDWISASKINNLYQPEISKGQLCCIYDTFYVHHTSIPNSECLIFILTDGKYYVPALIHPGLARDQLQLPSDLASSLSTVKGKVLLVNKFAIGAYRWSQGVFPYIITFDWMVLNVYESTLDPSITHISNNTQVKEWIVQLKDSLEKKSWGNKSVSTLCKTNLVERKFMNFSESEACLEYYLCCFLNVGTAFSENDPTESPNEESQVRSVGVSNKRCSAEDSSSQQEKKRSRSIAVEEDETMIDAIEFQSDDSISSIKHYTLDEFLTAEEYQLQVIEKMWNTEFEIPDSAIIPNSISTVNNTPVISIENMDVSITDSPTTTGDIVTTHPSVDNENSIIFETSTTTNIDNISNVTNTTSSLLLPDLTSSQLSSDNEEEISNRNAMYAEAEAIIINKIYEVGATTFERRRGYAQLRNLRLQRDTCDF